MCVILQCSPKTPGTVDRAILISNGIGVDGHFELLRFAESLGLDGWRLRSSVCAGDFVEISGNLIAASRRSGARTVGLADFMVIVRAKRAGYSITPEPAATSRAQTLITAWQEMRAPHFQFTGITRRLGRRLPSAVAVWQYKTVYRIVTSATSQFPS